MYVGAALQGCRNVGGCLGQTPAPAGTITPEAKMYAALLDRSGRQTNTWVWSGMSMLAVGVALWGVEQTGGKKGWGSGERHIPSTAKAVLMAATGLITAAIVGWRFDSRMVARYREELVAQGADPATLPS